MSIPAPVVAPLFKYRYLVRTRFYWFSLCVCVRGIFWFDCRTSITVRSGGCVRDSWALGLNQVTFLEDGGRRQRS